MSDEELIALQEELAAARAEVERLSEAAADAHARVAHLEGLTAGLQNELASARAEANDAQVELVALRARADTARAELAEARDQAKTAATKYKEAMLAAEPWLPTEMVTGESLAEIEDSLTQARRTVAQVKQRIDEQAQATRVPAGAPPRRAPDLSALSPLEKIKLGLEQRGQ